MARASLEGRRTHVILTKYQVRELRKLSAETGISTSEHLRRAVDFYLASLSGRLSTSRSKQT